MTVCNLTVHRNVPGSGIVRVYNRTLRPTKVVLLIVNTNNIFGRILISSNMNPTLNRTLANVNLPVTVAYFILTTTIHVVRNSTAMTYLATMKLIVPIVRRLGCSNTRVTTLSVYVTNNSVIIDRIGSTNF